MFFNTFGRLILKFKAAGNKINDVDDLPPFIPDDQQRVIFISPVVVENVEKSKVMTEPFQQFRFFLQIKSLWL